MYSLYSVADVKHMTMKLHVSLMICYICLQTIPNSLVEAGMNVTIINVTVNKTDPTYTKLYKLEVTPDSVVFAEGEVLKELKSIYVWKAELNL